MNALSVSEIKLYLLLNYTVLWYLLSITLRMLVRDNSLRFKFTSLFYYLVVPASLGIYLLLQAIKGDLALTIIHVHFLLLTVAFFIFATIEEFRTQTRYKWDLIIHHVVFGAFILFLVMGSDIKTLWLWVLVVQVSAIFVLSRSVLKEFPSLAQKHNSRLEEADYWVFLFVRIICQTALMLYILSEELSVYKPMNYAYVFIAALSMVFNVNWFWQLRRRKKMVLAEANRV